MLYGNSHMVLENNFYFIKKTLNIVSCASCYFYFLKGGDILRKFNLFAFVHFF